MKCIGSEKAVSKEEIEHIESLIGGSKIRCEDGYYVVRPASNEELGKVIASAVAHGASVAPYARKGCHTAGALLVDMSDMASIIELDKEHMTVKAQAGCKMGAIAKAVEDEGFTLGVMPAGEDPTVEDWIYTEEAGIGSYKYGTVKDSVYNVVAVDSNGGLLVTGFDDIGYYMSGYNLIQTLCASSGRLAIVTEVTFKISPEGVVKAAAYELPDTAKMQEAFLKIAHEASLKPLQISFNGNLAVFGFQGEEEFVDLDISMMDELMAGIGAAKADQATADEKLFTINTGACVNPDAVTVYVPLKNMDACIAAVKEVADFKVAGNMPDRSTVAIKLTGDVGDEKYAEAAEKAEEYGGRATNRCPSRYRDEPTKKFMRRIEQGFMGARPEEPKVSRQVDDVIIAKLKAIVGDVNVSTSGVDKVLYSHDMAPLPKEAGLAFKNLPDVIVRPTTTEQISKVVALAYEYGIPVTPRGSASWGLGGCMPTAGGILLDMSSKMKKVVEINEEELYVKVQAGCTWKNVLEACMKKGYIVGSMPSSFPSGTIGAWYSTNGMGIGSYKYGSARENVLNAEVIV
ncbi:MAG: FAD-binding oxidoreductase, partial [Thermoplasmata archaeon]|nr:FAD-binding oxidoreductase [Thermoplasmata archaeon]